MKNIFKFAVLVVLLLSAGKNNAQMGCLTPSLGVFDGNNFSPMSATIACTYTNLINISPSQWAVGNNGTTPCLQIKFSTTNANTATNNSLTISQGTQGVITSLCSSFPAPCYTAIPSSTQYSFSLFFVDPTQAHGYNLCNTNIAGAFNYTVCSCYNTTPLASGVWNNSTAGGCQTVTIPANSAIGLVGYTVSPGIPSTASINIGTGDLFLDTYQMAQGIYTISYSFNSQNACNIVTSRTISITNPWNANWSAIPAQCANGACVNLVPQITGNTGGTFSGTGISSNSFCPSSSGAGTFPITYTVGITPQCGRSFSNNVIVNAPPVANAGPTQSITCANATTVLVGSGGGTYNWSGPPGGIISGGTSANPTVGSTGNYSLTVTNGGCTSSLTTVNVVLNTTAPTGATLTPNLITCSSPNSNAAITATAGMNYSWTGPGIVSGATTSSPVINAAGNYIVTITDAANGCSSTATVTASQNKTVTNTPSTTGSVTCGNNSINLSTPGLGGYSYTWTAPGGSSITSGANSANATGAGPGNYSVTVFNSINGCSSTSIIAAVINQGPPAANASNVGIVNCTSSTVSLNSTSSGVTYTWVAPGGSSITGGGNTNAASASGGGTYTLLITSTANSCTNAATTAVTTQTAKPTANIINNPTLTCTNTLVTINGGPGAGAGVTYSWSGSSISGSATNSNVSVTGPGVYSLAVTSTSNGCTSTAPATVSITQNTTSPAVGPVGGNTALAVCNSTTAFTGSATPASSTPNWLGGVVSGGNTYTAAVSNPGTYTLVATNPANGCSAQTTFTLINSTGPVVNLSSTTGTVTCSNPTVQTVASTTSSPVSYAWSGPGIVGASNTATLNANLNGVYTLTLTNTITNCTVSTSYNVSANNASVTPNASAGNTVNCISTSANITTAPSGSGPFTYSWSTGATTSSVSVTPTTTTNYVVTVTNTANGCTGSQTISVTANTTPPTGVSVSPNTLTLTCANPSATLTASATGASSYTWMAPASGTVLSGANSATAGVSGAGVYTMVATASNGCSAAAQMATITPNSNAPTFNLSNANPSITCSNAAPGVSVTITSTVPIQSYSWSPVAGIAGSNTLSTVTFTAPGVYTGVITATNGCSTNTTVVVSSATNAPSIVAGSGTAQAISCTSSITTIAPVFSPATNLSYSWSGPGIVGSPTAGSIQANQPGSYSLTVTNTLTGCSSSSIVVPVSGSNIPPTLTVTSSSSIGISCQPNSSTVSLNAQSGAGSLTYTWSTGANTSTISTSSPGVYSVSITDAGSGCVTSGTINVQNNATAPNLNASSTGNLPCGGGTTSLNAVSSNTNVAYSWTGSGIVSGASSSSPVVNQAGVYTVTATNTITGCSSSSTVSISQTNVNALAAADATTGPAPLNINFTNQSTGATTYSWSFGDGNSSGITNPSYSYPSSGTYTVVLLATNGGCTSSDTIIIKVMDALGSIPEVFTPNGDGKNDVFVINGLDSYPNNNFQVFNRWGNPVYSAKPYKNDWDGSPNAAGKTGSGKLPTGTYYYLLELGDTDKTIFKGFIQIQY